MEKKYLDWHLIGKAQVLDNITGHVLWLILGRARENLLAESIFIMCEYKLKIIMM